MKVAILFNAVGENAKPDELDVLAQLEAVSEALNRLGAEVEHVPCGFDLGKIVSAVRKFDPDVVFNLVECLESYGRMIHVVPSLLDALGVTYTGSSAESLFLSSNKVLAKERMRAAGLPTPDWFGPWPSSNGTSIVKKRLSRRRRGSYIIKALWEHASFGMDDDVVVECSNEADLITRMKEFSCKLRGDCFAEEFIEGREFNLSVISTPRGPRVLPVAEILFMNYPEGKPKIVGYKAKWEEDAPEYIGTPRTFDFRGSDRKIISMLPRLAMAAWNLFALRGYARVDFRVDQNGEPHILEVNANPCINPDSGFVAAAQQGGLSYDNVVAGILEEALARSRLANC